MDNGVLIILLATAVAALLVLLWSRRVRRRRPETPQELYRRDVAALAPRSRALSSSVETDELWSAGSVSASKQSRAKKAGATLTAGLFGSGCGGCGGCGCGG